MSASEIVAIFLAAFLIIVMISASVSYNHEHKKWLKEHEERKYYEDLFNKYWMVKITLERVLNYPSLDEDDLEILNDYLEIKEKTIISDEKLSSLAAHEVMTLEIDKAVIELYEAKKNLIADS